MIAELASTDMSIAFDKSGAFVRGHVANRGHPGVMHDRNRAAFCGTAGAMAASRT
jgi:hypothetical protein